MSLAVDSAWRRWVEIGVVAVICHVFAVGVAAEPGTRALTPEQAFDYLHEVAKHRRCVNCHGMYRGGTRIPTVGDGMVPHPMIVTARHNPRPPCGPTDGERGITTGMQCTSCHGIANSLVPGGPPGAPDSPVPWQMPTRRITLLKTDISKWELCENWQAATQESLGHSERCGTPRTAAKFFLHHIENDLLIAWAFDPGLDRERAPGSFSLLKEAARTWAPMLENRRWCDTLKEGDRR